MKRNHVANESFQLERQDGGQLLLSGVLDHSNVVKAREEGEALLGQAGSTCSVSLSGLESAHSAVLSLLLCWLRFAVKRQLTLTFVDMPDQLYDMARVSGLDDLLPLSRQSKHHAEHEYSE